MGYDRERVHAVLDEATVCHVGFVVDGRPVVLPRLHVRVGEVLYLHGSTGARVLPMAECEGLPVCVTVTLLDGLVLARSAFNHSVNYRSVVVHRAEATEKTAALVDAVVPGRSAGSRAPDRRELAATTVLRLPLAEASLTSRSGPPGDDPADLALPHSAGVLPLRTVWDAPQPAPDLADDVELPDHVRHRVHDLPY